MAGLGEVNFFVRNVRRSDIVLQDHDTILRWCNLPYPRHKNGCPNSEDCWCFENDMREALKDTFQVVFAWVEWDIDQYEERMRELHPKWTKTQCRNLLYWQSSLRKKLRENVENYVGDVPCEVFYGAEGGGINFYRTMRKLGVRLDMPKDLHTVRIIAVVLA